MHQGFSFKRLLILGLGAASSWFVVQVLAVTAWPASILAQIIYGGLFLLASALVPRWCNGGALLDGIMIGSAMASASGVLGLAITILAT